MINDPSLSKLRISFSLRFSRSLKIDIKKYWEKEDNKDFVVTQPKPHEDQFISSSAITNSWLYHYNYVIMIIIEVLWKTEPPAGLCITTKLPRPPVLTVNVQETCKDHHSLPLLLHFFLKAHDKTKGRGYENFTCLSDEFPTEKIESIYHDYPLADNISFLLYFMCSLCVFVATLTSLKSFWFNLTGPKCSIMQWNDWINSRCMLNGTDHLPVQRLHFFSRMKTDLWPVRKTVQCAGS